MTTDIGDDNTKIDFLSVEDYNFVYAFHPEAMMFPDGTSYLALTIKTKVAVWTFDPKYKIEGVVMPCSMKFSKK
jgi:hypothetical protein